MMRRWLSLTAGVFALSAALVLQPAGAQEGAPDAPFEPLLVTYSVGAAPAEGDPDYRQIIYVALPKDAPPQFLWVFDPDTSGTFDTGFRSGEQSLTRMAVFGGPDAFRGPINAQDAPEILRMGTLIATRDFGPDAALDGEWLRFARLDPEEGAPFGDERLFRFQAEGIEGVTGNIFDVRLGDATGPSLDAPPGGARFFTYDITMRAPTPQVVIELEVSIPRAARTVEVRNFDLGGGVLDYVGPFRTRRLSASGNGQTVIDEVALDPVEPGADAILSFFGGRETPNDLSIALRVETAPGVWRPLAVGMPSVSDTRNSRPKAEALATPMSCRAVRLDGRFSQDAQNSPLTYRWILPGGLERTTPVALVRFPGAGEYPVRLEVDDQSGLPNSRAALDFTVALRDPPIAQIFAAPEVVAPGEPVRLSGAMSRLGAGTPDGVFVDEYQWTFGSETAEGMSTVARFDTPGVHTIGLTVTASDDHPCRTGEATATVRVNTPPIAEAGPDRTVVAGVPVLFEAEGSADPDGVVRTYRWDFGEGVTAEGPRVEVVFDEEGARTATLTVADDSGLANAIARDTAAIDVRLPGNLSPLARIAGPGRVPAGTPVEFDAAASEDPDGRLLDFQWRFGDGSAAVGPSARRAFFEPGRASVALELQDASGLPGDRAAAEIDVEVEAPRNRIPVADAGPDRTVLVGERVIFDANASRDPDGRILSYSWVFEPGAEATGPVAMHAFQRPGEYEVFLQVEDNDPQEPGRATATALVMVRPAGAQTQ